MKNEPLDFKKLRTIKRRKFLYSMALNLGLGALALKLLDMQVLNSDSFQSLSKINKTRIKLIAAPRGTIYDANGVVLATNLPSYNIITNSENADDINKTLNKLAKILNTDIADLKNNIRISQIRNPFFPAIVKSNISFEDMSFLNSFNEQFAGIEVEYDMLRYYPLAEIASHILGFINPSDKELDRKKYSNKIASMRTIGQSGVEAAYNELLTGEDGFVQNEVNSSGIQIRSLNEKQPLPGNDIKLTLNSGLQKFIYDTMSEKCAVIVMEARSGNIIAMVSKPGFNPNRYVSGISNTYWQSLNDNSESALINRCLRGLYSPGSTFKMLIAIAALNNGIVDQDTKINCNGSFYLGKKEYKCWKAGGHGKLNIKEAIEQSCNVFFYNLGDALKIGNIHKFADMFGFGKKTGINLPHELAGNLPAADKKTWLPGQTINISIGQGLLTVSPLQNLNYLNIIINDGKIIPPKLIADLDNQKEIKTLALQKSDIDLVKNGMHLCVNSDKGTGVSARSRLISIAGKTGTTQVISAENRQKIIEEKGMLDKKFQNHAWFLGYVDSTHLMPNNGLYSIAVLIEHADKSYYAARFAKEVMEYFAKSSV